MGSLVAGGGSKASAENRKASLFSSEAFVFMNWRGGNVGLNYFWCCFRPKPANPKSPAPSSSMVAGSGTGEVGV